MFRGTGELKGLAIDYDSFKNVPFYKWKKINSLIHCLLITSDSENKRISDENHYDISIIFIDKSQKFFSPNVRTHRKVLEELKMETTDIAYISSDCFFIRNACSFFSSTILISDSLGFKDTGILPDILLENIDILIVGLNKKKSGFCR